MLLGAAACPKVGLARGRRRVAWDRERPLPPAPARRSRLPQAVHGDRRRSRQDQTPAAPPRCCRRVVGETRHVRHTKAEPALCPGHGGATSGAAHAVLSPGRCRPSAGGQDGSRSTTSSTSSPASAPTWPRRWPRAATRFAPRRSPPADPRQRPQPCTPSLGVRLGAARRRIPPELLDGSFRGQRLASDRAITRRVESVSAQQVPGRGRGLRGGDPGVRLVRPPRARPPPPRVPPAPAGRRQPAAVPSTNLWLRELSMPAAGRGRAPRPTSPWPRRRRSARRGQRSRCCCRRRRAALSLPVASRVVPEARRLPVVRASRLRLPPSCQIDRGRPC